MVNLNVSLTETQRDWVEAQVKAGRYGNLSEYIRDLIRGDQSRAAERRLEELLLQGTKSGAPREITPAFWEELKGRVEDRLRVRKGGGGKAR
jgi:antitoxin ParD1/3/4